MKALAGFALLGLALTQEQNALSDGELFKVGTFLGHAAKTYNDVREAHPNAGKIINDGVQLIKDIKKHDDEELFELGTFLNDALKTYKDAKQHKPNVGNLVNDGLKLVKDIKHHDDELMGFYEVRDGVFLYHDEMPSDLEVIVEDEESEYEDIVPKTKFLRFKSTSSSTATAVLHCVDYYFGRV